MKRALPVSFALAASVALAACGGGGDSTPDANVSLPPAACAPPTQIVDTTGGHPIGDGTAASCTEAALDAALAMGGVSYFNCGDKPVTIVTNAEKVITQNTVLDGAGQVTLDGGGTHRLFTIRAAPDATEPILTVQRLTFAHGQGPAIAGGGGAIARIGGTLIVNSCVFSDNHGTQAGPDVAGGAISSQGTGPTLVVGSVFTGNSASSGGALGNSGNPIRIFNSRFSGNTATGKDGAGGDGGAVSVAGSGAALEICGSSFTGNKSSGLGGAVVHVAPAAETTSITRSTFKDNESKGAATAAGGGAYLAGSPTTVAQCAFVGNKAGSAGGLYVGGAGVTLTMEASTFAGNEATSSFGGGLSLDSGITGTASGITVTKNKAGSAGGAGIGGGGASGISLANSIIAGNSADGAAGGVGCAAAFMDGGGNLQFPDEPTACASGAMKVDPLLGELTEVTFEGGTDTTWVAEPGTGSPALGGGATNCGLADQRGKERPLPCTLGAVEPVPKAMP